MIWETGTLAVGVGSIILFVVAFHFSGLIRRTKAVLAIARETFGVISDKSVEDEEKEAFVQKAVFRLLKYFGIILLSIVALLGAPSLLVWICDLAGIASFTAVLDFLSSWKVILGASILMLITMRILSWR